MNIKEIRSLLSSLKKHYKQEIKESGEQGLDVTVATTDGRNWNYQTGDNSFHGACYSFQHWSVVTLMPDSHCGRLARDVVQELNDMVAEAEYYS